MHLLYNVHGGGNYQQKKKKKNVTMNMFFLSCEVCNFNMGVTSGPLNIKEIMKTLYSVLF